MIKPMWYNDYEQDIDYCDLYDNFICKEIMIRKKATVLDLRWLKWKELQRDNQK